MTCVVGVLEGGKVWMGADSAATDAYLGLTIRKDTKVFTLGKFIIGFCGSFRQGQAIRYHFTPPKHPRKVSTEQYMNTLFVDAFRKVLIDAGVAEKKDNVEELSGSFLVGYRGHLFHIEEDLQVGEPQQPFHAIGSGADAALGALFVTKKVAPRVRIIGALQAAQAFNAGVRAPFVTLEPAA